ncbi:MAG: lipopolysaccharide biosynthesis protein [Muribaculaceae bacterium]|nr:lipopolysaccharide biosynthesis protein [Muribaculaceae bacterium]
MSGELRDKTVRGVAWSFVERFSVQGVTFLLELVIARIIGPESYGLIAMLAIFMAVSQVFIDGGFSSALIQSKERDERDFSTVFWVNLAISLLAYTALFAAAPAIASFFGQPLLCDITRVYSLNLVINSLVAVNKTKLTIDVDFKTQSKISFFSALLSGLVGLAMALMGWGVWALVWQAIASAALNVVFSCWYVRWWPHERFSTKAFKRLFAFGSKLLVASLISSVYAKVYDMVIGKKFTSTDLGLYSRADKFNQFASTNISGILSRVSFPVLSEIQDDDARLLRVYRQYVQLSALVVFPLILGMCGLAAPLIHTLLGDRWMGCVPLLQVLCLAYVWDCVIMVNLNLIYVKGHSDYVLRLEVVKKLIAFGILLLTMQWGLLAICWGRVAYSLIAFWLNTYYTRRLLGYGFLTQLREILPMLLMSAVVASLGLGVTEMIKPAWLALAVGVIAGVITYVAMCYMFKIESFKQLLNIVKTRIHHA